MLKNYFKTAWRNLWNNRFYSMINICGLAIGLAVGIMILLWVQSELSYDNFHRNAADIYKINSHLGKGADAQIWEGSPGPLAVFLKQQVPEAVHVVRVNPVYDQILFSYKDKKFVESRMAFVDSGFFSLFDFKLLLGNPKKPFPDINSVILTSSTAKKYFGEDNPLGKTLKMDESNFAVSAIMEDFPENSSLQYDMLLPMAFFASTFGGNGDWKTIDEDLGNFDFITYVQIKKGSSAEVVAKKLSSIYQGNRDEESRDTYFTFQSLGSLHLYAADGSSGAAQTVKIFFVIAILLLLIACINYVNLSTARSMLRSKEVSVRKIIGAARSQLFMQFILEPVLIFLFASIMAFILIYSLLPLYNSISGKQVVFSLTNGNVWLVIGIATTGTLILSGIYPALLLSSFKPILALKGKFNSGIGNTFFRKILVITQFVFSVSLIIGTIVISKQLQYIRAKDLGYDKEYVFSFQLKSGIHNHYQAAREEFLKQPAIKGAASSQSTIVGLSNTTGDTYWEGKETNRTFLIHPNSIDENFIPLLGMQLAEGNNFTGSKADSAHFILNETAVKQAGIKDPVGKSFSLWNRKGIIIGIVKDFNYASLKQAIEPTIFYYSPPNWRMYIKTTGKDVSKAIAASQKVWKKYESDFPMSYSFLDEDFNRLYQADQRTGILFNTFAIVAIAISCLGLFGLATYTAQVKTKEIGIRKVLGASTAGLASMLSKDFLKLVAIAIMIASPVAYYLMYKWLQDFAYRINIQWWFFALAGLSAVLVALLTVSFQAIKAAIANPVKSLRSE